MYKKYVALFLVVVLLTIAWVATLAPSAFAYDCCERKGDIDGYYGVQCVENPGVWVSDVDYLIAYMFYDGPAPPCMGNADLSGGNPGCDGIVDLSDLTTLIGMCTGQAEPQCDCD